jgi:predicted alpha/beta-fold hydrolase
MGDELNSIAATEYLRDDLVSPWDVPTAFAPPPFSPHRLLRGGHLQTIVAIRSQDVGGLQPARHVIEVSEGDAIMLHEDRPLGWKQGDPSILLLHGLSGCHAAPYMLRLARRFVAQGVCVYRIDMRGCGAASDLTRNMTHAGRSDDLIRALDFIAARDLEGPLHAIGISLGASQLLRAVGRIGAGMDPTPEWFHRLARIAAVAPPLDLQRCSDNMNRLFLRPYNYYFIRSLLRGAPPGVKQREQFQQELRGPKPRTLRELDDRFTAPMSGFEDARDYYAKTSCNQVTCYNPVPTLVLTAADDPIVPIGCFTDDRRLWPRSTKLLITRTGGHVGFIDREKRSWMDQALDAWFAFEK